MSYISVFANPMGRTARGEFIGGLIVLVLVAAFYVWRVPGLNGAWVLFTLLFPAFVLHARRLHDMGLTAWLLLPPGVLLGAAIWPHSGPPASYAQPLLLAGLGVAALVALWCCVGKGKAEANKFGGPAGA